MKTQRITVMGKFPELDHKDVPAAFVKIDPRYVTFVHRDHHYYLSKEGLGNVSRSFYATWHVSEQSTGALITTGRTRAQAIENARHKMEEIGAEGMAIAINAYKARIKSYELIAI